jgi:ADP-ribose pyrophosphatase YjhB (NUDIX family)
LVNRKNEPAKDEWWVPGGRVLFGEKREDAAKRKLLEECNLKANDFKKIGNFEFFFDIADKKYHNIATLFEVTVDSSEVALDEQSSDYKWLKPEEWLKYNLSDFIIKTLTN